MFAITGITGRVGGVVARTLLAAGREVRAVVRNAEKGTAWREQGCDLAVAEMNDPIALAEAFNGAESVFILLPSNFDPVDGFPDSRRIIAAVREAIEVARPGKVLCLSTIGAQVTRPNLLNRLHILEQELHDLPMPVAFLRAGWFIDNAGWDVALAQTDGVIRSFLTPLDKPVAMVATLDVGRVAAEMLQDQWTGSRLVELEGPQRVTPNQLASAFSRLLGREILAQAIPRHTWEALFKSQGMKNPTPRIQMLDGFNEGWIEFEKGEAGSRKGNVSVDTVLRALLEG